MPTCTQTCTTLCVCVAPVSLLMVSVKGRWCDQSYRSEFDMQKTGASAAFWHQLFMSSQKHCEADEATDLWVPEPRGFSMGLMCEESQLKIIVTETWGMKGTQPEQRDHRWCGLWFWTARLLVGMEIKANTSWVMPGFRCTENLFSSNLTLFRWSSQLVALGKGVLQITFYVIRFLFSEDFLN